MTKTKYALLKDIVDNSLPEKDRVYPSVRNSLQQFIREEVARQLPAAIEKTIKDNIDLTVCFETPYPNPDLRLEREGKAIGCGVSVERLGDLT